MLHARQTGYIFPKYSVYYNSIQFIYIVGTQLYINTLTLIYIICDHLYRCEFHINFAKNEQHFISGLNIYLFSFLVTRYDVSFRGTGATPDACRLILKQTGMKDYEIGKTKVRYDIVNHRT